MAPTEDLSLYQAFFGEESAYYLGQLQKFREGRRLNFNPAITFQGVLWLIYRKLYKLAALVFAVLAIIFFVVMFTAGGTGARSIAFVFVLLAALVLWVALGFVANRIYLARAEAVVATAKSFETDTEQLDYVRSNGGVNRTGALLVIALVVLAVSFSMIR